MIESPTWPYVLHFAEHMERKLAQNRHKGDRDGWLNDPVLALLIRLQEEVWELLAAHEKGESVQDVIDEAADVGNFAMMVADVVESRGYVRLPDPPAREAREP